MTRNSDRLWIKICGIRDVETAIRVAELEADAIGLNFYPGSPRHVPSISLAREIVEAVPETVSVVGVFVNHSVPEILDIAEKTKLSTVQLHGDEPDEHIAALSTLRVIRALRMSSIESPVAAHLQKYVELRTAPDAWLIDAAVPGEYGGTGQVVDWDALRPDRREGWPRLILAGGLTLKNVAEAVRIVEPDGVDVASGVESAPGVKDLELVEHFIAACRHGD